MIRFDVSIPGAIGGEREFASLAEANEYARALKLQGFEPLIDANAFLADFHAAECSCWTTNGNVDCQAHQNFDCAPFPIRRGDFSP